MRMISNFPGYHVTEDGRIWSDKSDRFLKLFPGGTSLYYQVCLRKNNKSYFRLVHRLVLEAFVGPCPEGMEGCHGNGNNFDNDVANLRWDTRSANRQDAIRHGTFLRNVDHPNCKLTLEDIRMVIYMCSTKLFIQKEIADIYGICQQKVSQIINRRRHKTIWAR